MSTTAIRPRSISIGEWTLPGLGAGMVFAMWAMVVGVFTSTLWAPPQGIAQAVGIGIAGHDFQAGPLVLGLMGHMMNAMILGALFFAIVRAARITGTTALAAAGLVYGLAAYVVMYWVVLRGLLASTSGSFLSANPEWSWIAGHAMFGIALGLLVAAFGARQDARR